MKKSIGFLFSLFIAFILLGIAVITVGRRQSLFGNNGIHSDGGVSDLTVEDQREEADDYKASRVLPSASNETQEVLEKEASLSSPDNSHDDDAQEDNSATDFILYDVDGNETNYVLVYQDEEYMVRYTEDNWKIIDSYKITDTEVMTAICQAMLNIYPVHGRDMRSVRTAEDMAFEWLQHNIAYELLPDDNPWKKSTKDVDLNPADQNRTFQEMYEDRTGREFRIEDILK